jgi:hypothetical protein
MMQLKKYYFLMLAILLIILIVNIKSAGTLNSKMPQSDLLAVSMEEMETKEVKIQADELEIIEHEEIKTQTVDQEEESIVATIEMLSVLSYLCYNAIRF